MILSWYSAMVKVGWLTPNPSLALAMQVIVFEQLYEITGEMIDYDKV